MRGKRSKQYRKLMQQYGLHFGFREPYQVLLDAGVLLDAARFKMNFINMLSSTLHGQIKPMITQCSMRHLYNTNPRNDLVISHAKNFERRRCNHHTLKEPLTETECILSVVDPKRSRKNKHRYVVASQISQLRHAMRSIPGVPMIYLKRSVMIMEPMAGATEEVKARDEEAKFQAGLIGQRSAGNIAKRKSGDGVQQDAEGEDSAEEDASESDVEGTGQEAVQPRPSKRKKRGPSQPNPLSMRKPKKSAQSSTAQRSEAGKARKKRKRARHDEPATLQND